MIDQAEWDQACWELRGLAQEAGLIARLADQRERLEGWRVGDVTAGQMAADALDQLAGVLVDHEIELQRARTAVEYLMKQLLPSID